MSERDIFTAAREMTDSVARSAYLDGACRGDTGLRCRVEALLRAHDQPHSLLDNPAVAPHEPDSRTTRTNGQEGGAGTADEVTLGFLDPATRPDALGRIGHYDVLQVLGQGGFGIVLRAFDDALHRVVAVKVLSPQLAATSPARKRFLREARSSAQVRHENVVQVYEVEETPLPYIAMEFIPGETLQQRLDRVGPVEPAEVVRVGRQIAEGLAAAHTTDLIHRDIKPANVLLESGTQRVKITDFGLARTADDANISQSGIIAGTPMYMAPEQALGQRLDQRADLFSLGSVLYVMAAGRPPFRASSTVAVLKRVADNTPRDIREIIPETPQWLCDIIAKLHAKNPDERYQSAREVADVLAACEAELKIVGRGRDFSRIAGIAPPMRLRDRRRAMSMSVLLGLAAVGFAVVGSLVLFLLINGNRQAKDHPGHSSDGKPNAPTASEVRRFVGHGGPIRGVDLSPDGNLAVSCSGFPDGDRTIRLWDVATGAQVRQLLGHADQIDAVVFSHDGKRLLSAGWDKTVRLWDVGTGTEIRQLTGHTSKATVVAFSPDDRRAASGGHDGVVRLWDTDTGRELGQLLGHKGFVFGVAFSPDGRTVLSGSWDGTIRLWAADTFQEIRRIAAEEKAVWQVAFLPDNRRVVSGGDAGVVRVWDIETGKELQRMTGHKRQVLCLSVSPDGRHILSGGAEGMVRLWEVATGREVCNFGGYTDTVWAVAIARDGKHALYGGGGGIRDGIWQPGQDWTVRLWRLPDAVETSPSR